MLLGNDYCHGFSTVASVYNEVHYNEILLVTNPLKQKDNYVTCLNNTVIKKRHHLLSYHCIEFFFKK